MPSNEPRSEDPPSRSYLALVAAYLCSVLGLAFLSSRGGRAPQRLGAGDVAVLAAATHKISRLVTREKVTLPLREPFTDPVPGEPAELVRTPKPDGPRRAVGELITCPFCVSVWIATGLMGGMLFAPRATRLAAATLTAMEGSDALQYAFTALERRAAT